MSKKRADRKAIRKAVVEGSVDPKHRQVWSQVGDKWVPTHITVGQFTQRILDKVNGKV